MFLSGEMEYTYQKFRKVGLVKQVNLHSHTSQYGSMSRGIKFRNLPVTQIQKEILEHIETGKFAEEWESRFAKLKFRFLKFFATKTRINRVEQQVRTKLGLKAVDIFEEEPITDEDLKKFYEIKEELKEFEEFYREL